jgi:AraC-like DNA-binding protein
MVVYIQTRSRPFRELIEALAYVNERSPARQRSVNWFERERSSRPVALDFSGDSPQDVYCSAVRGIQAVLRRQPIRWARAWQLRNLGPREWHLSVHDIAALLHVSRATVYRVLARITDELATEFQRRELIEDYHQDQG